MDIKTILKKIKYNEGTFPREAVNEAIKNQELIIPELLKIIEFTKDNIEELNEDEEYFAHIYAMYLLSQFREKSAHQLITDFFSIYEDIPLNITGEVVTEDLSRILASVYDGNDNLIKSLIENKELNEYVRAAALESLLVLVAAGIKPREKIISYFKELFNGKLEREFSYVWNTLIMRSTSLYPKEVYDEIKLAYRDDLIEAFFIDLQTVEEVIKKGKEKTLRKLQNDSRYTLIKDTISEMQNWNCFQRSIDKKIKYEDTNNPENTKNKDTQSISTTKKRKKVGRNAPCPCGSKKKYKKCCLNK